MFNNTQKIKSYVQISKMKLKILVEDSVDTLHFQRGPTTGQTRRIAGHTRVVARVADCGLAQRQDQRVLIYLVVYGTQQWLSVFQPVDVDGQISRGDHAHDTHRLAAVDTVRIEMELLDLGQLCETIDTHKSRA